jgi:photosystem II stability/assembly factor-like uncharacterized protein
MNNKYIIGIALIVLFIGAFFFFSQSSGKSEKQPNSSTNNSTSRELIPTDEITHGHGLAVDIADPSKLYIATHHGLLLLKNEKELYRIGESEDDYMGFSPHPNDANVFFTSGHPSFGGNLGFQRSDDGGFTWKKVSDGVQGPVDFHAMTVSPVNPDLIFGWYRGALQRTTDGGKNWEIVQNTQFPVVSLAADTKDENIVYAASPQGFFVSKNKGTSFDRLFEGFVSVISINPSDSQQLLSFSEKKELAKSDDSGKTWEIINENFSGETPLFIAFNRQKPEIVYLLTEKNSIYKSIESGGSWEKVR